MDIQQEVKRIILDNKRFSMILKDYQIDHKARVFIYGWLDRLQNEFDDLQKNLKGEYSE